MNKYSRNFILCGEIDYHCLLCQETFHLIPDIEKHIRWEKHRKVMKDQTYFPKFKKDCIYKVGNYFYCQVCNSISSNLPEASEHVKTKGHNDSKVSPKLFAETAVPQYKSGKVTIKKLNLSKAQWNSVVDKKCMLCCIDVKNVDEHLRKQEHVIKLIQSETNYENDKYYRKMGATYHCFTCKKVFTPQSAFENHFSKCKVNDEVAVNDKATGLNKPAKNTPEMAKLQKHLVETLQEYFTINEKENKTTCKQCSKSFAINFNEVIMHLNTEHTIDNKKTKEAKLKSEKAIETELTRYVDIVDSGKRRSELAKYGKPHFIKLNHNGSKGYCTLCDRFISAHMTNFKEHVSGVIHQGHIELKTYEYEDSKICEAVHINNFIKSVRYSQEQQAFWINNEFWVDLSSLCLFHPVADKYLKTKCFACDEILDIGNEGIHCLSLVHKKNMNAARVLKLPREFIRELRSNLFHCGFCNLTFPFDTMGKHLSSYKHVFTMKDKLTMTEEYSNMDNVKNNDIYTQLIKFLITASP